MSSWDYIDSSTTVTPAGPDAATHRKVSLYVCGQLGTAAEARPILEALGLIKPLTGGTA